MLGTWHNKRVAIKIMQLPASCPFASGQKDPQPAALMAQNQANSPPHMAIMEAVLSSTVSHPNVSVHLQAQGQFLHLLCFNHRVIMLCQYVQFLGLSSIAQQQVSSMLPGMPRHSLAVRPCAVRGVQ